MDNSSPPSLDRRARARVVRVLGAMMILACAALSIAWLVGYHIGRGACTGTAALGAGGLLLLLAAGYRPLQDFVHDLLDRSLKS